MEHINKDGKIVNLELELKSKSSPFRNERDELVDEFVKSINITRLGTKYKPITHKTVALRINNNKKLKDVSEIRYLLDECNRRRSFSWFFYTCPLPINKYEK